jgi:hypothetical protein
MWSLGGDVISNAIVEREWSGLFVLLCIILLITIITIINFTINC